MRTVWRAIAKFWIDCFTGVDGTTWDLGRVLWGWAAAVLIEAGGAQAGAMTLSLYNDHVPLHVWGARDWVLWSGAVSSLLVAGAGALYIKRRTEPCATTVSVTQDTTLTPSVTTVERTQG